MTITAANRSFHKHEITLSDQLNEVQLNAKQ